MFSLMLATAGIHVQWFALLFQANPLGRQEPNLHHSAEWRRKR
jgi:hypothetical protein